MSDYQTVIGLETHAELNTRTKIFCRCKNEFGSEPNTNVCPVCLGLPGALPVLNRAVVEYAVRMGHALNCTINSVSALDRKNYFYPDLPKAYQISQSYLPLCVNGHLDFWYDGEVRRVRINRIHIEEDAGKLMHTSDNSDKTLIDFNRCGVPLIEIVTEPDLRSAGEAVAYLRTIKSILRYLDICDCRMQEGSIRCDVNVSLNREGEPFGTRCEMKNVNSFSAVGRAIDYEASRQLGILENSGTVRRQTRRWDDIKGESFVMRSKESADDYRYFPEPDIPPFEISEQTIKQLSETIPELPNIKLIRYVRDYGTDIRSAGYIADDEELSAFFDECVSSGKYKPKIYCDWIMGELVKYLNDTGKSFSHTHLTVCGINDLLDRISDRTVSATAAKKVFSVLVESDKTVNEIISELGLAQLSDDSELERVAAQVIAENEKSVSDYSNGKTNALGYLVGQCMKKTNGKADPVKVREKLLSLLG